MSTYVTVSRQSISDEELRALTNEHLALESCRVLRRVLVLRCGGVALVATLVGVFGHQLTLAARTVPVCLFLVPPVWAWIAERRIARRASQCRKS